MRWARFIAHDLRSGRFCANLLRISNFSHTVKLKVPVFIAVHAAQSLKQQPAEIDRIRPSQLWLAGHFLPGTAMVLFSVGFPTGVLSPTLI